MISRKRESSKWISSKELKDTTFIEDVPEGERGRPFVITPLGTRVRRILVSGIVTAKSIEENYTKLTVADNIGSFYVTVFNSEYQPETKEIADTLELNEAVTVMGRVNTFKTDDGVIYININPEKIMHVDSVMLKYWTSRCQRIAVRKILAISEMSKLDSPDKGKLVAMGYSDEEADCAIRHLEHYKSYDILGFREVITSASRIPAGEAEDASSAKDEVFQFIKTHADPQKGCKYEDIVAHMKEKNIDQAETDEFLNMLGSEGEIYEVALKRYKAV
jgi:RPA family protein